MCALFDRFVNVFVNISVSACAIHLTFFFQTVEYHLFLSIKLLDMFIKYANSYYYLIIQFYNFHYRQLFFILSNYRKLVITG